MRLRGFILALIFAVSLPLKAVAPLVAIPIAMGMSPAAATAALTSGATAIFTLFGAALSFLAMHNVSSGVVQSDKPSLVVQADAANLLSLPSTSLGPTSWVPVSGAFGYEPRPPSTQPLPGGVAFTYAGGGTTQYPGLPGYLRYSIQNATSTQLAAAFPSSPYSTALALAQAHAVYLGQPAANVINFTGPIATGDGRSYYKYRVSVGAGVEPYVGSASAQYFYAITSAACPSGYSPDLVAGNCALSSAANALNAAAQAADGQCLAILTPSGTAFQLFPGDPDCVFLPLSVGPTSITLKSPDGGSVEIAREPAATAPAPGVTVTRTTPDPSTGTTRREVLTARPPAAGQAPVINNVTTNYYQGVSTTPATSGATAAAPVYVVNQNTCGGPGQSPCSVNVENFPTTSTEGAPQPPPVLADEDCPDCESNKGQLSAFWLKFLSLKDLVVPLPPITCQSAFSRFTTMLQFGGQPVMVGFTTVCTLLDAQEQLIRKLFLIGWTLVAVLIVVDKTSGA